MIKRITIPVIALLLSVNAQTLNENSRRQQIQQVNEQILKAKTDAKEIAKAKFISTVTIPDQIEQSWDAFQNAVEQEVERRIQITSEQLKQTFARYKEVMEKAIVREQIVDHAWAETDIQMINNKPAECDMDCVTFCFSDIMYRFENVASVEQVCLVPSCNCTSGETEYETFTNSTGLWELDNFGTDRDLYDKNGVQIYQYIGDDLYARDLAPNGTWLDTWHLEKNTIDHDQAYAEKENYHDVIQEYQWTPYPQALYNIEKDCDIECSEDCMSLLGSYSLEVVDTCNVNKCNCYYSFVQFETCTNDCKVSCLFVEGGKTEINLCLNERCMCNKEKPVVSQLASHAHALIKDDDFKEDVVSVEIENTPAPQQNKRSFVSLVGGMETFIVTRSGSAPEVQIPIVTLSIAFAIFMALVLGVYLILLRKEIQNEKKQAILGYEDKNVYSQKLSFLDDQEVSVSTL